MDTNDEEGQSTAPSKDEVDDSNRKKTWFSVKTWRAMTTDLHMGKPTEGSSSEIQTEKP